MKNNMTTTTKIEIYTVKRAGMILKNRGYKLNNLPLHLRSSIDDDLNKYVKCLELDEYNELQKTIEEIQEVEDLLKETHNWFESNNFEVGCKCVGYIYVVRLDKVYHLWKR